MKITIEPDCQEEKDKGVKITVYENVWEFAISGTEIINKLKQLTLT